MLKQRINLMFKSISFYLGVLASVILGIYYGLHMKKSYNEYIEETEHFRRYGIININIDRYYLWRTTEPFYFLMLTIILMVLISARREMSNGIYKNRLLSGKGKAYLYFLEVAVGCIYAVIYFAFMMVAHLIFSHEALSDIPKQQIACFLGIMLLIAFTFVSITVLFATLASSGFSALVFIAIILFVLLIGLQFPFEDIEKIKYSEESPFEESDGNINVDKALLYSNPVGMMICIDDAGYAADRELYYVNEKELGRFENDRVWEMYNDFKWFPVFSLLQLVLINGAGVLIYRKKNLS